MNNTWNYLLAKHIHECGPIKTLRVSSAKSRLWPYYWDVVRYEIRLSVKTGHPINRPIGSASTAFRDRFKAMDAAKQIADAENRIICQEIGRLDESTAKKIYIHCCIWQSIKQMADNQNPKETEVER